MRLIDADAFIQMMEEKCDPESTLDPWVLSVCRGGVKMMPTVDAISVVRCRDCKHRPTGTDRDDLEFPDDKCPCQCEDYWYSWKPSDDWFCKNGERKDGEQHE